MNTNQDTYNDTYFSIIHGQPYDIPGNELGQLGIRIKYRRNPEDGTVLSTLAWRRTGNKIHFGISRYNPNDKNGDGHLNERVIEVPDGIKVVVSENKTQPSKAMGRREAIRHLYEAEKLLYDNNACFALGPRGTIGCCDEEGMGTMFDWLENGGYENWSR